MIWNQVVGPTGRLSFSVASFGKKTCLALALVASVVLLAGSAQAFTQISFDDGGTHVVDAIVDIESYYFVHNVNCSGMSGSSSTCSPSMGAPTTMFLDNGGQIYALDVYGTSTAYFVGGQVGDSSFATPLVRATDNALVEIYDVVTPNSLNLVTFGNSTINIYGQNFKLNGLPVPYGPIGPAFFDSLTGELGSGYSFQYYVYTGESPYTGTVNLIYVPEPGSIWLAGLAATLVAATRKRRSREA